jgi:hypothetical protein
VSFRCLGEGQRAEGERDALTHDHAVRIEFLNENLTFAGEDSTLVNLMFSVMERLPSLNGQGWLCAGVQEICSAGTGRETR